MSAICLTGIAAYVLLYLRQLISLDLPQLGTRGSIFIRAIIPDSFILDWTADGKMPVGVWDRFPIWGAAVLWYLIAWWLGDACLSACGCQFQGRKNADARWLRLQHPLAIAVGLGILSLTTLLVGLSGLLQPRYGMLVVVGVLVATATLVLQKWKCCRVDGLVLHQLNSTTRNETGDTQTSKLETATADLSTQQGDAAVGMTALQRRLARAFYVLLVICGIYYSFISVMPPIEFDVLEYHLQAPKEFWQRGAITFLPHNIYANMPLGAEMHALAWMALIGGEDGWWWGALVGKVIIGWMAPLTAWLLAAAIYEHCNRQGATEEERATAMLTATAGAVLYLTLPGIAEVSQFGQIDACLALYIMATAALCQRGWVSCQEKEDLRAVILIGAMCGFAFGIKYPALAFALAPAAFVVGWIAWSNHRSIMLVGRILAFLVLGFALTAGPWLIKNSVLAGNPVYPLAASLFGGRTLDERKYDQWQQAHAVPTQQAEDGVLVRYSFAQATASLAQVVYKTPLHNALLVPLFVTACFLRPRRETIGWLLWLGFGLAVWWLFSHRLDRFWLPMLPLVTWLAAFAVVPLLKVASGIPASALLFVGFAHSVIFLAAPPLNDPRYAVTLDALRKDISGESFGRVSDITGWLNDNLKGEDRVLLIGQAAVFDLTVPFDYSTCFDESKWEIILAEDSNEAKRKKFQELGITHVCIHWGEIERYRSPGNYGFRSNVTQQQVIELVAEGVLTDVRSGLNPALVSVLKVNPISKAE